MPLHVIDETTLTTPLDYDLVKGDASWGLTHHIWKNSHPNVRKEYVDLAYKRVKKKYPGITKKKMLERPTQEFHDHVHYGKPVLKRHKLKKKSLPLMYEEFGPLVGDVIKALWSLPEGHAATMNPDLLKGGKKCMCGNPIKGGGFKSPRFPKPLCAGCADQTDAVEIKMAKKKKR